MARAPISKILSHNLRLFRDELGYTQQKLAKKAGVTARSYQNLESGAANPTLNTIDALAKALEVTASKLISLDHIRLSEPLEQFLSRYEKAFASAPVGAGIRDHDGVLHFRNKKFREFFHAPESRDGKVDLMAILPVDARETLRLQLSSERRGLACSYVNYGLCQNDQERRFCRIYPCLVRKKNGASTFLSATYVTPVSEDCQKNYYQYCALLLTCLN